MSIKELDRVTIIEKVQAKQISQKEASKHLKLSTRQLRRLECIYEKNGVRGLVSKKRGKPSNNRLSDEIKEQAIRLIKQNYSDFGDSFAHEILTEAHQLAQSVKSVRKLMIKENIWRGKKRKAAQYQPMRQRRSSLGELVQI